MKALIINTSPVRNGATGDITQRVAAHLEKAGSAKAVCMADFDIRFCLGCRVCHHTGVCVQQGDDFASLMEQLSLANVIIFVSPSYWADVPAQFKCFIDRCTPWCDTHEPHASLQPGKKAYAVILRTGSGMRECDRLEETITHYLGHMQIAYGGALKLTNVACRQDAEARREEVAQFCDRILAQESKGPC